MSTGKVGGNNSALAFNRTSNYGVQNKMQRFVQRLNNDVADNITRTSTGVKHLTYAELGVKTRLTTNLQTDLQQAATCRETSKTVGVFLNRSHQALDSLASVARELDKMVTQGNAVKGTADAGYMGRLTALKDQMVVLMNEKFEGRYLFNGSANEATVDPAAITPTTSVAPSYTYYKGDNTRPIAQLNGEVAIPYGALGNQTGMERLVCAMRIALSTTSEANPSGVNSDNLKNAQSIAAEAFTQLTAMKADLGSQIGRVEKNNEELEAAEYVIKQALDDILYLDISDMAELDMQTQLKIQIIDSTLYSQMSLLRSMREQVRMSTT